MNFIENLKIVQECDPPFYEFHKFDWKSDETDFNYISQLMESFFQDFSLIPDPLGSARVKDFWFIEFSSEK